VGVGSKERAEEGVEVVIVGKLFVRMRLRKERKKKK
jgi:hypothetical protein